MTQSVHKWYAAAVVIAALLGLLLTSTTAPVAASSIYSVPTIASVDTQALDRAEVSPMQLPDHRERSISRAATAAVTLRLAASFVAPNGLPPLRQQYVDAVGGIDETISGMRAAGASAEDIERAAHGDPLGPSIDWLRDAGKSWDEIIDGAARTGGQDLGF